jgi:hypothetical protein
MVPIQQLFGSLPRMQRLEAVNCDERGAAQEFATGVPARSRRSFCSDVTAWKHNSTGFLVLGKELGYV